MPPKCVWREPLNRVGDPQAEGLRRAVIQRTYQTTCLKLSLRRAVCVHRRTVGPEPVRLKISFKSGHSAVTFGRALRFSDWCSASRSRSGQGP